jgi:hypothetical protein
MAQHRFAALMTLWFLLALSWTGLLWPDRAPFLYSAPVALFVLVQVLAQNRLLGLQRHLPGLACLRFATAAIAAYALFAALEVAFWSGVSFSKMIDFELLFENALSLLRTFLTPTALFPAAVWYGAFWGVLRAGWIRVPVGLLAAGLHGSASVLATIPFMGTIHGNPPWPWPLLVPVGFFFGWGLMFLPGAVAAQEYPPMRSEQRSPLKALLAMGAPAAAWIVADSLTKFVFDS